MLTKKKGITRVTVEGFKSLHKSTSIEIRPLTILAGPNSSGKTSIMQPLLLLKQTLNASYDPGPLMLNGPNVKFTAAEQLLSNVDGTCTNTLGIRIQVDGTKELSLDFARDEGTGFVIKQMNSHFENKVYHFYEGMTSNELLSELPSDFQGLLRKLPDNVKTPHLVVTRNRCFLAVTLKVGQEPTILVPSEKLYSSENLFPALKVGQEPDIPVPIPELIPEVGVYIGYLVHLPGLRGNPERYYPISAVGADFPGTFENYVASLIRRWQLHNRRDILEKLNRDLARLKLANSVSAVPANDTQVEIRVSRFLASRGDMVSIADVGFGVSQALPVLVALHAAANEQLIYLEQPEIHLHPRAQHTLAEVLADAVLQGKHIVVETHSSLLLLGIQTLVATGKLPADLVKLHWFQQREDGSTQVDSADLDENGAFGDWPEDFADVALNSEGNYLDAVHMRVFGDKK